MKKLLFTPVVLIILLTIGCQENITDPIIKDSLNKPNSVSGINIIRGEIPLDCIIPDRTIMGVEYYNLNGTILFEHRLLGGPDPVAIVALSLSTKATLQNITGSSPMMITSETLDTLVIVNEFSRYYVLKKSFPIQAIYRNLVFSFLVTPESIKLDGICLEIPEY
jgi:hypothetical protein